MLIKVQNLGFIVKYLLEEFILDCMLLLFNSFVNLKAAASVNVTNESWFFSVFGHSNEDCNDEQTF